MEFFCFCRERVRPCLVGFSFSSVSADPGRRKKIRPEKSCFISIPDGFLLRPLWVFAGSESGFVLDLKLAARLFAHDDQRRQEPAGRFFHFSSWEIHPTDFFTETSGTSGFGGGSERSRHWATRKLELFFALTTLFIFPQTFLNLWWDK